MKKINHQVLLGVGIIILVVLIIVGRGSDDGLTDSYETPQIEEIDIQNGTYDNSEEPGVLSRIFSFPRQLWTLITNPSEEQMRFFLRDGFAFNGNRQDGEFSEEIPRIGMRRNDAEDLYMLTWQPAEGFVRQSQLIHDQEDQRDIPQARYINSDEPLVYIFNSHPHEMVGSSFADVNIGEMSVIELSHMMANIFEDYGIPSLVEDRDVRHIINANGWVFDDSYRASRIFIEERIRQYPSLQFFFDIHRDGIARELATITINGQTYGRILFVIGGNNPAGHIENFEMAYRLHTMLEEVRPGLSRGIQVHTGAWQNAVYNQDIASTLQLIEIGTVETTAEEAMNTMEILADVLATYILNYID